MLRALLLCKPWSFLVLLVLSIGSLVLNTEPRCRMPTSARLVAYSAATQIGSSLRSTTNIGPSPVAVAVA
jgi:hypothetical protein